MIDVYHRCKKRFFTFFYFGPVFLRFQRFSFLFERFFYIYDVNRSVTAGRQGKRPHGQPCTSLLFHDHDDCSRHRHRLRAVHQARSVLGQRRPREGQGKAHCQVGRRVSGSRTVRGLRTFLDRCLMFNCADVENSPV